MKVVCIFLLVLVTISNSEAQFFGSSPAPSINIIQVFRFLINMYNTIMYGDQTKTTTKKPLDRTTTTDLPTTPGLKDEMQEHMEVTTLLEGLLDNLQKSRRDVDAEESSSLNDLELQQINDLAAKMECLDGDTTCVSSPLVEVAQEKTTNFLNSIIGTFSLGNLLTVNKWPAVYMACIAVLFGLYVGVSVPYLVGGGATAFDKHPEAFGRSDNEISSFVDRSDLLLLITWLLSEASDDISCLERVVCLTPQKSAWYLNVASVTATGAKFLSSWVPYNSYYEKLISRLQDVVLDGKNSACDAYVCNTVPSL